MLRDERDEQTFIHCMIEEQTNKITLPNRVMDLLPITFIQYAWTIFHHKAELILDPMY